MSENCEKLIKIMKGHYSNFENPADIYKVFFSLTNQGELFCFRTDELSFTLDEWHEFFRFVEQKEDLAAYIFAMPTYDVYDIDKTPEQAKAVCLEKGKQTYYKLTLIKSENTANLTIQELEKKQDTDKIWRRFTRVFDDIELSPNVDLELFEKTLTRLKRTRASFHKRLLNRAAI